MKYIISSTNDAGTTLSFSPNPHQHELYHLAQQEASRLANVTPGKKFVIWEAKAVAEVPSVQVVKWSQP
jgi:hypothetical protein